MATRGVSAGGMSQQNAHHLLRIDPVALALLRLAVHEQARSVKHDRLDGHLLLQPARNPEPFVIGFVAARYAHLVTKSPLRSRPLTLDQILQALHIRAAKRVGADAFARRTLMPTTQPFPLISIATYSVPCSVLADAASSFVESTRCLLMRLRNNRTVTPVLTRPHRICGDVGDSDCSRHLEDCRGVPSDGRSHAAMPVAHIRGRPDALRLIGPPASRH